jgi:probable HAF family extracellular repeat protein
MKSRILTFMSAMILFAAVAAPVQLTAQTNYNVIPLPGLGGTAGGANSINDRGWATGSANLSGDQFSHATLWTNGAKVDLGTLGGPNSAVAWPVKNNNGLVVGISETAAMDPLHEDFSCPYFFPTVPFTGHSCQGFRWQNSVMTALPPFEGGHNSYATAANNRGQVVGWAENGVHDPTCVAPQVLQFIAVIWGPNGEMQELPPLPGDSTSAATAINDKGQVVGISGACGIAVGGVSAAHAVLWENGVPTDIGNLGGHSWNTPTAINNQGTVVGFSLLAGQDGTRNYEAFIWTKEGGIHSLGKPPGDIRSAAFGINDKGQVVGQSRGGPNVFRAILWENGILTDLNTLTVPGSLFLLYANDINNAGEIVGEAFDPSTLEAPAYVAIPTRTGTGASTAVRESPKVNLPEKVLQRLRHIRGFDMGDQ